MNESETSPNYLNVRETAARLGVHENTIRNWVREGTLKSSRLPGTKFHRFDERDVERLRQQRGALVSSVEPERSMIGPELVDARQLDSWADTREAQSKFPELVRRLLASTPGITAIAIRAGEGVSAPGWDGTATSEGTSYLPGGELGFEFSVGSNPKLKAEENFEKRRNDPLAKRWVFVFMTPRNWPGTAKWVTARRAEGVFRDVWVLDAHGLEGWLQRIPAVHHWISELLGRRPKDAQTLEAWWTSFRSRTEPLLPRELFLAGRSNEQAQLREFLRGAPDVIAVQAPWREEAIAFVFAAIQGAEGLPLPLIVRSAEVWDWVASEKGRVILLPLFPDPSITAATSRGHHVILPVGREQVARRGTIELPPLDRQAATEALQAIPMDLARAYRLSALARRSMHSLIRQLSKDPALARPLWSSERSSSAVLAPLLLIGAWTNTDEDREVVSRMAGGDWSDIERILVHWENTDDPPFVRAGTQWHLALPEDALHFLGGLLTDHDLRRWREIAVETLLEPDPTLELPADKKPMAAILGTKRKSSPVLRRGLAEGIALVGSAGLDHLPDCASAPEHAGMVVREILSKANSDSSGRTWHSLSDVLPLLAEAAPAAFLDVVNDDLAGPSPALATMFQDHGQSSWFAGSSPHTGLLWALETLCWSSEWILESCRALARLDQLDPGGRFANRPLVSLHGVLVGWVRHTSAPLERRVEVVKAICRESPDVGWKLLMKLWPEPMSTASPPAAPRFRDWKPESSRPTVAEWVEFIGHLVSLGLGLAQSDVGRWAELAEHVSPLPVLERDRVLNFLDHLADSRRIDPQARLLLWERVRKTATNHRRFQSADWSLKGEALSRLETIARRLEPDGVERYGYLFDWCPDRGGTDLDDMEAHENRLHELRLEAVRSALNEKNTESLRRLAERSPVPSKLGSVVGELAPEELTPTLLLWLDSEDEKLRDVAVNWASRKLHDKGVAWLRDVLSRSEMASAARRIALVRGAPPTRELWEELEKANQELQRAYWQGMNPWQVGRGDTDYAARRLLAFDRAWITADLLARNGYRKEDEQRPRNVSLVEAVLRGILESAPNCIRSQSADFHVGQLLDYLEAEGLESEKLAWYESMFFELLEYHRPARALATALGTDPCLFIDFVKRVYRGKNEPKRQVGDKEGAMARHAWSVLHGWRDLPGQSQDGSIDQGHLTRWVQEARLAFSDCDRADIGDEEIGRVLSGSPPGIDGIWPAEPVRELLETIGSTFVETGIHVGVVNRQGVTTRGPYEGGRQERETAGQYRRWSKATESKWPRTSRLLRRLAEEYERDARHMDERARISADTE